MRAAWRTFGVLGLVWVLMLSLPLRAWAHTGATWPSAPGTPTSLSAPQNDSLVAMPCHEAVPELAALATQQAQPDATPSPCPHGHGCVWCAACAAGTAANAALPLAMTLAGMGVVPAGHQPWVHASAVVALDWAPAVPTPPPRPRA